MASRSPPPAPRAVLFDLDGTILDSFEGLARCYRHALSALGRPPPSDDDLRPCIGPPLRGNLARFLGDDDPATVERAVGLFRERYGSVGWTESRLYDGVVEMVEAARSRGLRVLVATGKPQAYADRILDHFGLRARLDGVFGTRMDPSLDDKERLVAHALATAGLEGAAAVLVGDRENDVRAARRNGATPLGALWGYGTAEELTAAGARILCASPAEVLPHLGVAAGR